MLRMTVMKMRAVAALLSMFRRGCFATSFRFKRAARYNAKRKGDLWFDSKSPSPCKPSLLGEYPWCPWTLQPQCWGNSPRNLTGATACPGTISFLYVMSLSYHGGAKLLLYASQECAMWLSHCMAMGHGKGRLGDTVKVQGQQHCTQVRRPGPPWHPDLIYVLTQLSIRSLSPDQEVYGYMNGISPSLWVLIRSDTGMPCKWQPCMYLPSGVVPHPPSHSWLQPPRLAPGKTLPCGTGVATCHRISRSLWSHVPHEKNM